MTAQGQGPQSLFAEVNGQRLHYKKWPDSGPPLVLLHGLTSSSAGWDFVAPFFKEEYTVMALDLRGHGLSSKPERGYGWAEDYAADVAEFVTGHLDGPAFLMGHSLGAAVTAPVAVKAPDRVRAIVMEDPPLFPRDRARDEYKMVLNIKRLPPDLRVERLMQTMSLNQRAAERRSEELEAMHEGVLEELIQGGPTYAAEDWLPQLACPALVILGSPQRGGVVSWDDRPRIERLLRTAKIVEWDDVGHLIHFQKMERFVEEVKGFLRTA